MTRLKLSALLLGATALTLPLGTSAYAQQAQGQQGQQQPANQQGQEMGACERLYQLIEEAADERILSEFEQAPQVSEANQVDQCALVITQIEQAGGISEEAVAESRGIRVTTETETFRASDTVQETVQITREAIVEGEVLVRQPIPEVQIQQGRAEVQVRERPKRLTVNEQPAEILIRQKQANVRVAMPRPTILIEQPAPEIIITMPAPGLEVEQDQPEINVVMAEPTVTVTQGEPQVEVNVDARLVGEGELASTGNQPRVQTRTQRMTAQGQQAEGNQAEVSVSRMQPSIRFLAAEQEDNVRFNRQNPRVVYEPAEPNIEVTFNEEPRVELRQTGEPRVTVRRQGDASQGQQIQQGQQNQQGQNQQGQNQQGQNQQGQQNQPAMLQGGQASMQAGQQANTQAGQQASMQPQQGQASVANVAGSDGGMLRVEERMQSVGRAFQQQDVQTARTEVEAMGRDVDMAMQNADDQQRQQLQSFRDQVGMVLVEIDRNNLQGAQTAFMDAEANYQQNRESWMGAQTAAMGNQQVAAGQQQPAQRLSIEDTNRLLGMEEGYSGGQAQLTQIRASDLRDADVHTIRGEEVGEIEEIVTANGALYAIVSHGGFLGIGEDDVAIPLERIAMRGNEVVLLGLTEEQLEQMPNYDFNSDQAFSGDETIEIGRFE